MTPFLDSLARRLARRDLIFWLLAAATLLSGLSVRQWQLGSGWNALWSSYLLLLAGLGLSSGLSPAKSAERLCNHVALLSLCALSLPFLAPLYAASYASLPLWFLLFFPLLWVSAFLGFGTLLRLLLPLPKAAAQLISYLGVGAYALITGWPPALLGAFSGSTQASAPTSNVILAVTATLALATFLYNALNAQLHNLKARA